MMNIVFFGTSEFAIPALRELMGSKHKILEVVTQPDAKKGRRLRLSPPPTKVLASTKGIPVFQPKDASSRESVGHLKRLSAEVFVVIAFGQILKKEVLEVPKHYCINLHGSLLPRYRGAAPTNWAVINGDKSSGITLIKMNEKMDEGDIIIKREVVIEDEDTNITLGEKLSELGAKIILETIDLIESGKAPKPAKQNSQEATYAPKLKKEDGLIDWSEDAKTIHNKVRGLLPWPGAYTYYNGKMLKILKTSFSNAEDMDGYAKNGEVLDVVKDKGIIVRTGGSRRRLAIEYLQLEGKKALDSSSFVRGHRIPRGHVFAE